MPVVHNGGPLPIVASYAGFIIRIGPGERKRINGFKVGHERYMAEDIAAHLVQHHGIQGLTLVDEENPLPRAEQAALGARAFVDWVIEEADRFNALNQKQAAQNLPIMYPTKAWKAIREKAAELAATIGADAGADFIDRGTLDSIKERTKDSMMDTLERTLSMMQAGDVEGAQAFFKSRTEGIVEAGISGGPLPVPSPAGAEAVAPAPAAAADSPAAPVVPEFEHPARPLGAGPGRVPHHAQIAGKRRPKPATE